MDKKKSIAVIGANGQLGGELIEILDSWGVVPLNGPPEEDIDITDLESIRRSLSKGEIDWVINTAAFTDVPRSEELKSLAYEVNTIGAKNVAVVCKEINAGLIHISTDYVFDGEKGTPYLEDDKPNPQNYYGFTKAEAERMIQEEMSRYYILRTSGLYGIYGCLVKGENFVDKMLRLSREKEKTEELKVVDNEVLTPTSARSLSLQIKKLIEASPQPGIYHATNSGECSWFDFTKEIFKIAGIDTVITPVHQKDMHSPVKRPKYSVLENGAFKKAGIDNMNEWKVALKDYLKEKMK